MKKFIKFETGTKAEKKPEVKSVLLQTYFTSLMCLVLCVSMFFGTSYAWFTSEVVNEANEIYIGTLDVGLYKIPANGDPIDLATVKDQPGETLFNGNIRWEPGYTSLETIKIVNEGDMAFKYVLNFTDGKLNNPTTKTTEAEVKVEDVAKFFDVWVFKHKENETFTKPDSYDAIIADNSGWVNAGTLDEVLAGEFVLEGEMTEVRNLTDTIAEDAFDGKKTEVTYTVALHMNEAADHTVMGKRIGLNVKLVAYQIMSEEDDLGGEYDKEITPVIDMEELKNALEDNSTDNVLLVTDFNLADAEDRLTMNCEILDGNGKKIKYSVEKTNSDDPSLGVLTTTGGTICNLTIESTNAGRALYMEELKSDLYVTGCTLSGAYSFNLNSATVTEYTLNFRDTTFKSWTSYGNVMKKANFNDCTFEDVLRPYGDTILTNCVFGANGKLDLSKLETGERVTLINCTYNGVEGVNLVITANGTGFDVINVDDLVVNINNDKSLLVYKENN